MSFLGGVQVWGCFRESGNSQMAFVCDGKQQWFTAVVPFTDQHLYLCSISRLSAHINIPSPWASDVSAFVFTVRSQANIWTFGQRDQGWTIEREAYSLNEFQRNIILFMMQDLWFYPKKNIDFTYLPNKNSWLTCVPTEHLWSCVLNFTLPAKNLLSFK